MESTLRFGVGSSSPSNINSTFMKTLTPQGHTTLPMTTAGDKLSGNQRAWVSGEYGHEKHH